MNKNGLILFIIGFLFVVIIAIGGYCQVKKQKNLRKRLKFKVVF